MLKSMIKKIILKLIIVDFIFSLIDRIIKKINLYMIISLSDKFITHWKNGEILHGPFQGMKYINSRQIFGSIAVPKIIGTYESELNLPLLKIISSKYGIIIDIGSGEGYYAVGLALRLKNINVIAFDQDKYNREICMKIAKLNNVESLVKQYGTCQIENLIEITNQYPSGLIICDIEGYEAELLNPNKIMNLCNFDMLVELHELNFYPHSIFEEFKNRFNITHDITYININPKKDSEILKNSFNSIKRKLLINENRKISVGWIFLKALNKNNNSQTN